MTAAQYTHDSDRSARPFTWTTDGEGSGSGSGTALSPAIGPEMSDTCLARVDSTPSVWLFG